MTRTARTQQSRARRPGPSERDGPHPACKRLYPWASSTGPARKPPLLNIFEPLWKESYDKGAGVSAKLYNLQGVQRPELISTAKLRGGARVKGITETTQQSIAGIVPLAWSTETAEPLSPSRLNRRCRPRHPGRGPSPQECNTSLLTGHYDMMRKAGAAWKTWHVANMSAARPSHKRLNGERVPIDAKFSNGLMRPCDPGLLRPRRGRKLPLFPDIRQVRRTPDGIYRDAGPGGRPICWH